MCAAYFPSSFKGIWQTPSPTHGSVILVQYKATFLVIDVLVTWANQIPSLGILSWNESPVFPAALLNRGHVNSRAVRGTHFLSCAQGNKASQPSVREDNELSVQRDAERQSRGREMLWRPQKLQRWILWPSRISLTSGFLRCPLQSQQILFSL